MWNTEIANIKYKGAVFLHLPTATCRKWDSENRNITSGDVTEQHVDIDKVMRSEIQPNHPIPMSKIYATLTSRRGVTFIWVCNTVHPYRCNVSPIWASVYWKRCWALFGPEVKIISLLEGRVPQGYDRQTDEVPTPPYGSIVSKLTKFGTASHLVKRHFSVDDAPTTQEGPEAEHQPLKLLGPILLRSQFAHTVWHRATTLRCGPKTRMMGLPDGQKQL